MRLKIKGMAAARKRISWIRKHWPKIQEMAAKRAAVAFGDLLKVEKKYLHLVYFKGDDNKIFYGVSVEPDKVPTKISEIGQRILYIVPKDEMSHIKLKDIIEMEPYTPYTLPRFDAELAFILARECSLFEYESVMDENRTFYKGATISSPDDTYDLQDDVAYNHARKEFALGDEHGSKPGWREGFNRMKNGIWQTVLNKTVDDMVNGRISKDSMPEFEERDMRILKDWANSPLINMFEG
jgi:hypothetical protein